MKNKLALIILTSLVSSTAFAQGTEASGGLSEPLLWIIYTIVGLLLVVTYLLYRVTVSLKRYLKGETAETKMYEGRSTWEKIFQLKPMGTDKDTMINEPHDGIYELDNPPPPWFMFLFYATIVFAVVYFIRYQVTGAGMTQEEEYLAEIEQVEQQQTETLAEEGAAVDENTVVALTDASSIDAGRKIYTQYCKICHDADGKGNIGPNLTDEYWKHGGGVKNVFKTIKYGVIEKGMTAWEGTLSPQMMQQVSSYILSLQGTNPEGGKAPEGDLWVPEEEAAPAAEESAEEVTEVADETTTEG